MPTRADPVPPNSILAAVDGSPGSDAAIAFALRIAPAMGLSICGIYVIEESLVLDPYASYAAEIGDPERLPTRDDLLVKLEHRGEEMLERLVERSHAAGVQVTTRVLLGGVQPTLLQQAHDAELLALGRSGARHAAKAGELGSHFHGIARHCPRPLLVGTSEVGELRRLLVPYDGSPSAGAALGWAVRLRRPLDADVLIVNISADEQPRNETLAVPRSPRSCLRPRRITATRF
jgi:nucleotide-binding universal stress UspA family protein